MLVLSRRETEKVVFPGLGITVEVLRVQGHSTKLGIDAPPEVPILRHEIAGPNAIEFPADSGTASEKLSGLAHAVRRQLDSAANALNRLHQHLDEDQSQIGQQIVMDLFHDLQSLERDANRALEGSSQAKSITVLVVEDSIIERKLLGGVLEMSGMNVITAGDGKEALDFLSLHAMPDAVLLDMLMPRCDGPEFVKQVRADPKFKILKIFAVSGTDPSELGLATGEGGLDGWFPKPLEPGELICVLTQRLHGETDKTMQFTLSSPALPA